MADEGWNLPPLKRAVIRDHEPAVLRRESRKRPRASPQSDPVSPALFSNSSDPAVFSSDDDQSAENYTQGQQHRKRHYVGSWFQRNPHPAWPSSAPEGPTTTTATTNTTMTPAQGPAPSRERTRTLTRQLDSGVWMASDEAESDGLDDGPVTVPLPVPKALLSSARQRTLSPVEQEMERRISACVESGNEAIDLALLGLETLSNGALMPLAEFITIPIVVDGVPFVQRDPRLELYLSTNRLCRLPGSVFDIGRHLTVLSLRNNSLTELPASIWKLRNLTMLNVAHNKLRYLPAELLDLMCDPTTTKLRSLQIHPNPFLLPEPDELEWVHSMWGTFFHTVYIPDLAPMGYAGFLCTRSPVQFSDAYGNAASDFNLAEAGSPVPTTATAGRRPGLRRGGVPTLLDVALRSCYNSPSLPQLASLVRGVPHLDRLLRRVTEQREAGGQWCYRCPTKSLVTAKTEWLEWWSLAKFDSVKETVEPLVDEGQPSEGPGHGTSMMVPFVQRGCSWRCTPDTVYPGEWVHDSPPRF